LVVNVIPSRLDRVLLSSRLQDRERAGKIIQEMTQEFLIGEDDEHES
jgi:hypothetical protein